MDVANDDTAYCEHVSHSGNWHLKSQQLLHPRRPVIKQRPKPFQIVSSFRRLYARLRPVIMALIMLPNSGPIRFNWSPSLRYEARLIYAIDSMV